MINYNLFENEQYYSDIVYDYYSNGGEEGKEPPEILNALNILKEYGEMHRKLMVATGWM